MPDEPSGYELQRSIDALRSDIRNVVANTVNTGTHAAELRRIDDRLNDLKTDIAELAADQDKQRAAARNAKQWAVGTALSAFATAAAIVAVVTDRL